MTDRVLRCAVAGAGRMGKHHSRLYAQSDGVEFVGVCDPDSSRAQSICEQQGGKPFATIESLLDAGIDCLTVATPTVTHLAICEPALARGVHCLVEKPLAGDVVEARAIADAAKKSGCVLQVGHVVRYDPVMRAVRAVQGVRPRFIEMDRISPMTFRSVDVGVVLDMMIHDLDLLMMLMGSEPEEIHANAVCVLGDAEDVCNARLIFPAAADGIRPVANVTASRLALKTERKLRIISEDGYISADFVARSGSVVRKTANRAQLDEVRAQLASGADLSGVDYMSLVAVEPLDVKDGEPLKLQLEDFLSAVRMGRAPEVDAETGFASVRTAERIVAAARAAGARKI
ncbi:MAG: Gfo/Idh/MocA family oxidoreductase [Planctomycetota bacterium]|nr:Gfo/Idh/MocA family oxidoreductase [Planctomycetota bacterium]